MDDDVRKYLDLCKEKKDAESSLRGLWCDPDDERDRPRIEAGRKSFARRIEDIKAEIVATPADVVAEAKAATVSFPCAGARDGCRTRVRREGDFCRRCAFDEE